MPNPLLQMVTQASVPEKHRPAAGTQTAMPPEVDFRDVMNGILTSSPAESDVEEPETPEVSANVTPEIETSDAEPAAEVAAVNNAQPLPPEERQPTPETATAVPATPRPAEQHAKNGTSALNHVAHVDIKGAPEAATPLDRPRAPQADKSAPAKPEFAIAQSGSQTAIQAKFARIAKPARELTVAAASEVRVQPTAAVNGPATTEKEILPPEVSSAVRANTMTAEAGISPFENAASAEPEVPDAAPIKEQPSSLLRETTIGQPSQPARAELARAIAAQMTTVISAKPGTVEVALNPEELGRVSITFSGRDDGAYLTIVAERPETLDLMRRHISVLAAEFQKLGYGDLSFDLGTPEDSQQDTQDAESGAGGTLTGTQDEPTPANQPRPIRPDGGLDMRL